MSYKKLSHVGCTHAVAHSLLHNLPNNSVLHCSEVKKKKRERKTKKKKFSVCCPLGTDFIVIWNPRAAADTWLSLYSYINENK